MKVGIVGVGEMGAAMAGHLAAKRHDVSAYDVDRAKLKAVAERGVAVAGGLEALAETAEIFLVVVSTDEQSAAVIETLSQHAKDGALVVVVATNHPNTMKDLAALCASRRSSSRSTCACTAIRSCRSSTCSGSTPSRSSTPRVGSCT